MRRPGRAGGGGTRAAPRPPRSPRSSGTVMAWSGRSASGQILATAGGPAAKLVGPRFDDRQVIEVVAMDGRIYPAPGRLVADRVGRQVVGDGQHAPAGVFEATHELGARH